MRQKTSSHYIMSKEGQQVISDNGYIGDDSAEAYAGSKAIRESCCRRILFRITGYGKTDRGI